MDAAKELARAVEGSFQRIQFTPDLLPSDINGSEIYRAEYRGFYSTRQEQFLQEKDRQPDGTWPEIYGEVTQITESNYFLSWRDTRRGLWIS